MNVSFTVPTPTRHASIASVFIAGREEPRSLDAFETAVAEEDDAAVLSTSCLLRKLQVEKRMVWEGMPACG